MNVVRPGKVGTRSARRASGSGPATTGRRPRDAAATQERILDAAIEEFAAHGYDGARIDAVARRSDANMRMIYHYFGSKDALYIAVLEHVFEDIRAKESRLRLRDLEPLPAMMKLFDFTYNHFASNPLFVRLLSGENFLGARYLKESNRVPVISSPLMDAIRDVLARGEAGGDFRPGIDPLQLYVTMVAFSYVHLSNAPTLSHLFGVNMGSARWRADRRRHASEMLIAYLQNPAGGRKGGDARA